MKLQAIIRNYIKADAELQSMERREEELNDSLENSQDLDNEEYEDAKWERLTLRDQIKKTQAKKEKIETLFYGFDPTESEYDIMVEKAMSKLGLTASDYAMENLYYSNWY